MKRDMMLFVHCGSVEVMLKESMIKHPPAQLCAFSSRIIHCESVVRFIGNVNDHTTKT